MLIEITPEQREILLEALRNRTDLLFRYSEAYKESGNKVAQKDCIEEMNTASRVLDYIKHPPVEPAGVKEFVVHVTRTTTAELDLLARAYREEDAVEQAAEAMGRHDVAEAITARAKAKDYFEPHQAYATEEHVDFHI